MEKDRFLFVEPDRRPVSPSLAEGAQPLPRQGPLGNNPIMQTQQEDELVLRLVQEHGPKNWSFIAKQLPGRIGKQCRERWHNHLNPQISKDKWTEEED